MSKDIVFECPQCHQWLEAPPDMAGLFVECPKCAAVVKIPASSASPEVPAKKSRDMTPQPAPADPDESLKSSTIRIDLPPNLGIPQAPKRRLTIRRKS